MTAHAAPRPHDRERIPRILLRAIFALVLLTLAGVTALRLGGVEPIAQPPEAAVAGKVTVVLAEPEGGGVELRAPGGEAALATLAPGSDGFLRGVIRVLGFERNRAGIEGNPPVELIRWDDGRTSLHDPATGWRMEFQGFGKENLATVARLMSDVSDRTGGQP
jgi:putative photosynthetic complex assembly protein